MAMHTTRSDQQVSTGSKHPDRIWKIVIPYFTVLLIFAINSLALAEESMVFTLNSTTKKPLSTPEQNGFLDLIAKKALAKINIDMKILFLPAERALRDANDGVLDGELSRVPGLEKSYTNLLLVPEKLMDLEFTVFSIKHKSIGPGWEGLNNTSVAFLNGWKILERNVPKSAEITKVHSPTQLFELLKLGRADYVIYEKWGGIALAREMNIKDVNALNPPLAVRGMHMYLHKKHSNFVAPLTNAIKTLKEDGYYQQIFKTTLEPFIKSQ